MSDLILLIFGKYRTHQSFLLIFHRKAGRASSLGSEGTKNNKPEELVDWTVNSAHARSPLCICYEDHAPREKAGEKEFRYKQ